MTVKRTRNNEFYVPTTTLKVVNGDYLRNGDRFVAIKVAPVAGRAAETVVTGAAAIDGHMVAEGFGFRGNNEFFRNLLDTGAWETKDGYINVHLDDVEYSYNSNESLKLFEWEFYVSAEVYDRVQRDILDNMVWGERKKLERELQAERTLRDDLAHRFGASERKIQTIRTKIDRLNKGVK